MAIVRLLLSMLCIGATLPWGVRASIINSGGGNRVHPNLRRRSTQVQVCPDRTTSCHDGSICVLRTTNDDNVGADGDGGSDIFQRNDNRVSRYECGENSSPSAPVKDEESPLDILDRLFLDRPSSSSTPTTFNSTNNNSTADATDSGHDDDEGRSFRNNGTAAVAALLVDVDDSTSVPLRSNSVVSTEEVPDDDIVLRAPFGVDTSRGSFIPTEDLISTDDANEATDPAAASKHGDSDDKEDSNNGDDGSASKSAIYFLVATFAFVILEIMCLRWVELRVRAARWLEEAEPDPFLNDASFLSATTMSVELDLDLAKREAQVALEDSDDDETEVEDSQSFEDLILL